MLTHKSALRTTFKTSNEAKLKVVKEKLATMEKFIISHIGAVERKEAEQKASR